MLAIVFAVTGSRVDVTSAAEPPDRGADELAIREVIAGTTDALNKHDAAAFVGFYTPDADLVTVRGESMKGTTDIERGLSRIFATRAQHVTLKTIDVRVRFIRSDIAVAHVANELSGLVDSEGRALPAHRELSIRVFVKEKGAWRVTAFHNTMLSPAEDTAAQLTVLAIPFPRSQPADLLRLLAEADNVHDSTDWGSGSLDLPGDHGTSLDKVDTSG